MVANHYGYGLRNDEKPFAHKIPPGGNWKSLPADDQAAFMKGALHSGGGQTMYLRRLKWDEPACTVLASPLGKASCQLHPGEDSEMAANHDRKPLGHITESRIADGSYGEYIRKHPINEMDKPCYTITGAQLGRGPNGLYWPDNHDPKPLSEAALAYLYANWEHRASRINEMEKPCNTVSSVWAKGVPYGIVNPGEGEGGAEMIYDVIPQLEQNGYTVCEFFAGGGLMGMGVKRSGCNIIWGNDFEKTACAAYGHNIGRHIVHGDITKIKAANIPSADIYCGGPPCQDYSVAGEGAGEEGKRGSLVWRYLAIIKLKQPKAFMFENVKGLITKKHMHTFQRLLKRFERIGFNVSWQVVNSWDYGVAQKRERVFIVGIRKDLGFRYKFPDPKPEEYRTQVLRDVIGDLPEPAQKTVGANVKAAEHKASMDQPSPTVTTQFRCQSIEIENHLQTESTTVKPHQVLSGQRSYKAEWDKPGKTVNVCRLDHAEIHPGPIDEVAAALENHDVKPLSDYVLNKIEEGGYDNHFRRHPPGRMDKPCPTVMAHFAKGGPDGIVFPANHDPDSVNPAYIQNVLDGKTTTNYGTGIPVNDGSTPAKTLISEYRAKCPNEVTGVHGRPRRFTVRECLRIQSVPDSYVLPDSISLSAQYRIVGNGVASKVAYDLMNALVSQLDGANPMKLGQQDLFDFM